MKNVFLILVVLFLSSCGANSNKKDDKNKDVKHEQKSALKNDCEKFLDDYEKWTDEVVKIYKKAQENPLDIENTKKMMEATQEMSEWSQKWSKLYDCANNEKYAQRMEDIQKKIEQQMQ